MHLVFMGTPAFAVPTLQALLDSPHKITAVYTQPPRAKGRGLKETPSPVHQLAAGHGIPVYTPVSLKSSETQAEFAAHKADAAIVAAYGLLLPKPILEAYPLGCINVHPSLLPRWRGAAPIQRTVMAGDRETGITIMQMDKGLDTGDILLVERTPIPEGTTAGMLHDTLAQKAGPLVLKTLEGLQNKTIAPVKQPDTGITYANKITKDDCRIDWNRPAEAIYHQILGLAPSPGAFFRHCEEPQATKQSSPAQLSGLLRSLTLPRNDEGAEIKILDATYDPASTHAAPGTVIDNKLGIACSQGVLHPTILQRPGKKRMHADELLRGFSIPAGTLLSPPPLAGEG